MIFDASYELNRDNIHTTSCWISDNTSCLPHFHSCMEFCYLTSGETTAILDSHFYEAKKGDMLIVPSYTIHTFQTPVSCHGFVLTIPFDIISSYKTVFENKTFSELVLRADDIDEEIIHCIRSIYSFCNPPKSDNTSDPVDYSNIIKGYSYIFVGLLVNKIGLTDITTRKMTSRAQDILVYLEEHFLEPITLEQIASSFNYSSSRFSHIFNGFFGCSLSEYVNGLRCKYALELLEENKDNITDVALAAGFDSVRTFYRTFNKQFGMSPTKYINKAK